MTRDQLRTKTVEVAAKILNHAAAMQFGYEDRAVVEAARNLFVCDDDTLDLLYRTLPPVMRSEP